MHRPTIYDCRAFILFATRVNLKISNCFIKLVVVEVSLLNWNGHEIPLRRCWMMKLINGKFVEWNNKNCSSYGDKEWKIMFCHSDKLTHKNTTSLRVWPDVGIKCPQFFSNCCPKVYFTLQSDTFQNSRSNHQLF